jgi:hypothetical protein
LPHLWLFRTCFGDFLAILRRIPVVKARSSFAWSNRADIAPPLAPDRGHHCLYPKDVEIVDECREAELGAHVIDASHQEGALIHPLLDAAEGMLDDLAATFLNAARLSLLKSAMVLKSGFKVRNSQMTSMLRWHSISSRRLDRTRLR